MSVILSVTAIKNENPFGKDIENEHAMTTAADLQRQDNPFAVVNNVFRPKIELK